MEALAIIPIGDFAVGVASCRETRMVYNDLHYFNHALISGILY